MLKQRLLLLLSTLVLSPMVLAKPFEYKTCTNCGYRNPVHKHNEASYKKDWCKEHNGIEENQNEDFTRVDCLTDNTQLNLTLQTSGLKASVKLCIIKK